METWCLVGVVVPIGAVQEGCREDLVAGKMNSEYPKTLWPLFTQAGELDEAEAFRRLYSSILCARRRWNGENQVLREMWFCLF
jgi:hypothetical protein